jgi:acetyl-CoA synthetase
MTDQNQATEPKLLYPPSADVIKNARIKDWDAESKRALADPQAYWANCAKELEWTAPWTKVLDDSNKPFFKWFVDGKTNIVHNAVDRHANSERRNKLAYIWQGEDGSERTLTYGELDVAINKFANGLKKLGVTRGDRVTIYMGRVLELPIAMLACAKIGAIHSVVYGGFSVDALRGRINDSQSKVVITCDGAFVSGKHIDLKDIVDTALYTDPPTLVKDVVVFQRTKRDVKMYNEADRRDHWWHDLVADCPETCETEVMDAEDPLFILYTSGSTGKPKALLHTHGGYSVYTYTTFRNVFDVREDDRYWCAADPGWITGHSYIVYAPLMNGITSIIYEGGPSYPAPDRWWSIVAKYKVTILYTAPTAIRGLMRFGSDWPRKHDLSSLRLLGSVGEPINPEAWRWFYENIGGSRCPIMDTWWQTETGGFMITARGRSLRSALRSSTIKATRSRLATRAT